MQVTPHMLLIVCPLVFLAGFVDSIGGGGGLISLPAYLFAGVPPHTALATNKLSSSIGTTVSATRLFRYMDLPLAGACVVCSILGSWGGSSLALLASEELVRFMLLPAITYRFLNLAMAVCGAWAFGQVPICGQCRH